jgi:hypothetical protein
VNSSPSTLNCDGISIIGNTIHNSTTANSPVGIYVSNSSQTNVISIGNQVSGCTTPISTYTGTGSIIRSNRGYKTGGNGTGTINSGATTATVTHGLDITPSAANIRVTFTENPTNDPGNWWASSIGSSTFVVNVRADPGASNLDFSWSVAD